MPAPIEIIVTGVDDSNAAFGSAVANVDRLAGGVDKTNDKLGMSRREWMRTGSEAAFYARTAVASLGQVDEGLGKAIGLATQLGESFMYGNVIGVGIAAASTLIGIVAGQMQEAKAQAAESIKAQENLKKSLFELSEPENKLAKDIKDNLGVTTAQATAMADLASKNEAYRAELVARVNMDEQMKNAGLDVSSALRVLTHVTETYNAVLLTQPGNIDVARQAMLDAQVTYDLANGRLRDLSKVREADIATLASAKDASEADALAKVYETEALNALARSQKTASVLDDYWTRQQQMGKMAADAKTKSLIDQAAAIEKIANTVRGYVSQAVGSALTPTTVTPEDMTAAGGGTYTDKWDETRRRWESIAKGEGGQFTAEARMLDRLGLSADKAASKFKDFSLFADPRNMAFIGWETLTQDVEDQLDSMIGKFNVTEDAMQQTWITMPEAKKLALQKMGITSADAATRRAFGLDETMKVDASQAPSFLSNLQTMRGIIESTLGGQITIDVVANGGGGGGNGSENMAPGAPLGAAGQPIGIMDSGGYGVARAGQMFRASANELYWFGGSNNQVPAPSNINVYLTGAPPGTRRDAKQLAREIGREFQRYRA